MIYDSREELIAALFSMRDERYAAFQAPLIPDIPPESIIGVRTPLMRKTAKALIKEGKTGIVLNELPHRYFDENQLHAFIISEIRDFDMCIAELERFLPFVDNWATCDQLSPKAFVKNHGRLKDHIWDWIASDRVYTIRFAVGMLMKHYLGDDYSPEYPEAVASIRSDDYYVRMMCAWYFCTALTKRYSDILPYIEERRLPVWVHNKTIQKCSESLAIPDERKEYLKTLKIATGKIR